MNSKQKWISPCSTEILKSFAKCKEIEYNLRLLAKKLSTNVNLDLLDHFEFQSLIEDSRNYLNESNKMQCNLVKRIKSFSSNKNAQKNLYNILLREKALIISRNLERRHYQLVFFINKMVKSLLYMCSQSNAVLNTTLLSCKLFNQSVEMLVDTFVYAAKVCSNTFPELLLRPKNLDIGVILQIISKNRSERCSLSLISCLLTACKLELAPGDDNDSDTSSVEILRTLTQHMTSPKDRDTLIATFKNLPQDSDSFDSKSLGINNIGIKEELLENLILSEEKFIQEIIEKSLELDGNSPGSVSLQNHKKWIIRSNRSLWTQIGGTLDNIILWWSDAPLCCRPVVCVSQLRDWLLLMNDEDAPEPILSTLKGLGESLTAYVTTAIWDQQFRLALVGSSTQSQGLTHVKTMNVNGTETGNLWCELLSTLTSLSNSCDQNGTIPNQLPIVEQIPILHRLDHSIHSMRLWAIAKAKSLCSDWNMQNFFKVVHNDIENCLQHLKTLRLPELAPTDSFEVLLQVCVALRAKLISEIKVNILKLKSTCNECIDILSSTCRTRALATLSLCFPKVKQWKTSMAQEKCGEYVHYYLNQVYLPILEATKDFEILGLCLRIICEAWLDHIYTKKIKFSRFGAFNLLKDFDGVAEWIKNCSAITEEHREILSKHEVLRTCEGVGRILLRKPDEIVSILPPLKYSKMNTDPDDEEFKEDDNAQLPPEMFVPNQKRWLELRARDSRQNCFCICNGILVKDKSMYL